MATPTSTTATSTTATSTTAAGADLVGPPPQASSHLAPRVYCPASARTPPLFAAQPLPGRPLTSPTQSHPPQPVLHSSANRSFPPRVSTPYRPDYHIPIPNTVGFTKPPGAPNALMTISAAHMRPISLEKQGSMLRGKAPSPLQTQSMPSPYLVPRPIVAVTPSITSAAAFPNGSGSAELAGPSKNAQAAAHTKASSAPPVPLAPDVKNSKEREKTRDDDVVMIHGRKASSAPPVPLAPDVKNSKEREKTRDDDVVMIHGRKVRLPDSGSSSLYSLCRSWALNGMPYETQPNFGNSERLLPKPLPASIVDSQMSQDCKGDVETEGPLKEESAGSVDVLSTRDLLDEHIKRAKRVRARLRKERLLRIERYKQRISLLLPPPSELDRDDVTSPD